jgi:hypothetical protein
LEKVGLSRGYDTANLRRKLKHGIVELEKAGFLLPLADDDRFRKVCCGEWRVLFERARPGLSEQHAEFKPSSKGDDLKAALVDRGVTATVAQHIVTRFPLDRVGAQLEEFDWLKSRSDRRVSQNPAGFLVSAIKAAYLTEVFRRRRHR